MLDKFQHHVDGLNSSLEMMLHSVSSTNTVSEPRLLSDVSRKTYKVLSDFVLCPGSDKTPKRLRPLLVVLTAENLSQDLPQDYESLYRAALAVELYHNSTLVHDDMVDEDDWRRGLPSVPKACQNHYPQDANGARYFRSANIQGAYSHALMIGNLLSHHAIEQLMKSGSRNTPEIISELNQAAIRVNQGQVLDLQPIETVDDYITMIHLKTARLFSASARIGAYLSDIPANQKDRYADMAGEIFTPAGIAFQVQDDILDISPDREDKRGSDIRSGKRNILYLALLDTGNGNDIEEFKRYFGNPKLRPQELDMAIGILKDTGAVDKAEQVRDLHYRRSDELLRLFFSDCPNQIECVFRDYMDMLTYRRR